MNEVHFSHLFEIIVNSLKHNRLFCWHLCDFQWYMHCFIDFCQEELSIRYILCVEIERSKRGLTVRFSFESLNKSTGHYNRELISFWHDPFCGQCFLTLQVLDELMLVHRIHYYSNILVHNKQSVWLHWVRSNIAYFCIRLRQKLGTFDRMLQKHLLF